MKGLLKDKKQKLGVIIFFFISIMFGCIDKEVKNNSKENSLNNIRNGINTYFYDNGNVKSEINYKNGKKEGVSKFYYSNGNVHIKSNYQEDMKNGFYEIYDSLTKKILTRIEYINAPCYYQSDNDEFVNRLWYYIGGDTSVATNNSNVYLIRKSVNNEGINIKVHLSSKNTINGYDEYFFIFGDCSKEENMDSIKISFEEQQWIKYNYKFKDDDIKRGYVMGVIGANDIFVDSLKYTQEITTRHMFFIWSIKEDKLVNNKLNEITEWGSIK